MLPGAGGTQLASQFQVILPLCVPMQVHVSGALDLISNVHPYIIVLFSWCKASWRKLKVAICVKHWYIYQYLLIMNKYNQPHSQVPTAFSCKWQKAEQGWTGCMKEWELCIGYAGAWVVSFATVLLKYEELCGLLQLVHMTSYSPQSPGDYGATLLLWTSFTDTYTHKR